MAATLSKETVELLVKLIKEMHGAAEWEITIIEKDGDVLRIKYSEHVRNDDA